MTYLPTKTATSYSLCVAFHILGVLGHREQSGQGQEIHCTMVDGLISMFTFATGAFFAIGKLPLQNGNDHMIVSPYGLFQDSEES